jgi:UDP-galactopyranose mutase
MKYDFLIVGAGLYGAVFARLATDAGKKCLVIEKRNHPGGNIYCENIDGINVHKYGAHIFHTSNEEVWEFVNRYVRFNRYTNCPVAKAPDGKMYNLPFNMNTFCKLWGVETPVEAEAKLEEQRREAKEKMAADGVAEPRNLEEQALTLIGRDVYELLIKHYTEKQWGRPCTELPAYIIRRLPVRLVFDNNYFNDLYQGIPEGGYNKLIDALLEGVEVRLDTDYLTDRANFDSLAEHIIYTGPIDEYFDFKLGNLQWRTVRFETEKLENPNYQGNAVINYTAGDVPYTRIIEHKHFEMFGQAVYDNPLTVISREYSTEWTPGMEPYYPVNDSRNNELIGKYRELAEELKPRVFFGGRLGTYTYLDMDKVIAKVLADFKEIMA